MSKVIIDFSRMRETALELQAENVLTKMTGNDLFPDPYPSLSELESDLLAYRASMVAAALGDRQLVIQKGRKREKLETTLRFLGFYVERVSLGDRALILEAGYESHKTAQQQGPCPKPAGLWTKPQEIKSGRIAVGVKRERTARMYRFEYRLSGTETWAVFQSTRSRVILEGLESFVLYDFRVAYIGTDPTITYSDVISNYVL